MNVIAYIVIALAFGIDAMITLYRQMKINPIRLTRGMALSAIVTLTFVMMMWLGVIVGNLLRFESNGDAGVYASSNVLVYLGFSVVVVLKMWSALRREKKAKETVEFDLNRWTTILALSAAMGINVLLIGVGVGFLPTEEMKIPHILLPLLLVFVFAYWGIMMGRQKKPLREQRWRYVSLLLLLGIALYQAIALL